jgi:hypothetical protein
MLQNYKFKKEITKQEITSLSKYTEKINDDISIDKRMNMYVNIIETLTLEILTRSGTLCSSTLPLRHYNNNPPRVMIRCAGEAVVLIGKFRTDLESECLLDELENLLRKIISKASYIASVKRFQTSSHGICIISNAGSALSLIGRLRLDQFSMKPNTTNTTPLIEEVPEPTPVSPLPIVAPTPVVPEPAAPIFVPVPEIKIVDLEPDLNLMPEVPASRITEPEVKIVDLEPDLNLMPEVPASRITEPEVPAASATIASAAVEVLTE